MCDPLVILKEVHNAVFKVETDAFSVSVVNVS